MNNSLIDLFNITDIIILLNFSIYIAKIKVARSMKHYNKWKDIMWWVVKVRYTFNKIHSNDVFMKYRRYDASEVIIRREVYTEPGQTTKWVIAKRWGTEVDGSYNIENWVRHGRKVMSKYYFIMRKEIT